MAYELACGDLDFLGPISGETRTIMACPVCAEKAWRGCVSCGWEQWSPPDDPDERRGDDPQQHTDIVMLNGMSTLDGEWCGLLSGDEAATAAAIEMTTRQLQI